MTAIDSTSRFLTAPQDYEAGGASFRPGSAHRVAASVDGAEKNRVATAETTNYFGADGLDFGDVLDMVNPLQHLPGVGQVYRAITGDEISPAARIAGGSIYGGPIGLLVSAGSAFLEEAFGGGATTTAVAAAPADAAGVENAPAMRLAAADPAVLPASAPAATPAPAPAAAAAMSPPHPQAAAIAEAMEQQDAPTGLPAQAGSPMGAAGMPELSPEAFQALMTSIGAVPEQAAAARAGLTAGSDGSGLPAGGERAAARDLHHMLQSHAAQQGLVLPAVRR